MRRERMITEAMLEHRKPIRSRNSQTPRIDHRFYIETEREKKNLTEKLIYF